jgi:hypothetical protein
VPGAFSSASAIVILLEKRKKEKLLFFFFEGPPPLTAVAVPSSKYCDLWMPTPPFIFPGGLSGNEYRSHVILAEKGDTLTRAFGHREINTHQASKQKKKKRKEKPLQL